MYKYAWVYFPKMFSYLTNKLYNIGQKQECT